MPEITGVCVCACVQAKGKSEHALKYGWCIAPRAGVRMMPHLLKDMHRSMQTTLFHSSVEHSMSMHLCSSAEESAPSLHSHMVMLNTGIQHTGSICT